MSLDSSKFQAASKAAELWLNSALGNIAELCQRHDDTGIALAYRC